MALRTGKAMLPRRCRSVPRFNNKNLADSIPRESNHSTSLVWYLRRDHERSHTKDES
jgi:hypothetical protein